MEGMKRSLDGGGIAPPPKKMNLEGSSSGTSGPAFDDLSAYEQMSVQFLLRKNAALVASVSSTKRQLGDAEARERAAQVLLDSRDNALSVYERQWAQLEEQLALLLASLEGASPREATAEPGAGGDSALLQLFTPVSPLEPDAKLEAPLQARTARMVEIGRAIVTAIASAKAGAGSTVPTDPNAPSSGGDALAQRLQVERAALTAEARRLRDQAAKAEAALVQSLDQAREAGVAADKAVKTLHRERAKAATNSSSEPSAAVPAATAAAAAATVSAGGGGAALAAAAASEAEAKEDAAAQRQLAEARLGEVQKAQVEVARLRAAEEEARKRPPSDEALRQHPAFTKLMMEVKALHERTQMSDAKILTLRNDTAHINTLRHSESARFDDYRIQVQQEASETAAAHAAEVAKVTSERRSVELQLAQINLTQKREADRANDLDDRLRTHMQEAQRVAKEITRLKEAHRTSQMELERAQRAEEASTAKAKALDLQLKDGGNGASGNGDGEDGDDKKRYQDALVQLGTAELKASRAQQELKSQQGAQEALMGEIEAVSAAYEEVQTKNDELRGTVGLKDEALARAKADKMRADHTATLIKQENQALKDKAVVLEKEREAFQALKASFEGQLRKSGTALQKKEEEVSKFEALLTQQKASVQTAQATAQAAQGTLKQAQDAEARAKEREDKAAAATAAEAAQVQRLSAERDSLNRRLARTAATGGGGHSCGRGVGASDLEDQLEIYRTKVKCSLCKVNDKDAIITKCMHSFCRECIQKRLDVRNRKCPGCNQQFDYQAVKDLFLTS